MEPVLEQPVWWRLAARTWWFGWLVGSWLWFRPSSVALLIGFAVATGGLAASAVCCASAGDQRARAWLAVEAADDLLYVCAVPAMVFLFQPSGWLWLPLLIMAPVSLLFLFIAGSRVKRLFGRT